MFCGDRGSLGYRPTMVQIFTLVIFFESFFGDFIAKCILENSLSKPVSGCTILRETSNEYF